MLIIVFILPQSSDVWVVGGIPEVLPVTGPQTLLFAALLWKNLGYATHMPPTTKSDTSEV